MKILRQNVLLKVLSLNSISVMVSFVLGIFSAKIVSVFLGPAGMALLGSFRNFSAMVKSVATLGVNNSAIRLFVENKEDSKALSAVYSTFFWLFLLVSSVMAALLLLLANPISAFLFYTDHYAMPVRFFGMLLPLMAINAFWIAIYNGWAKYKKIVLIQIISNVLIFAFTGLLIWKQQLYGGLLAMGLGEALLFLVTFFYVQSDRALFRFELVRKIDRKYTGVIGKFSAMALLSAILIPLVLILVRNHIVDRWGVEQAGIWDAVNRLSGFYMTLFSSGLSLYYMPKLASLHTESAFKGELKSYFRSFIPLFVLMLLLLFVFKDAVLALAFTQQFAAVNELLIWQMLGDLVKMMTLAFGFQILVKTRMRDYFIVELVFNGCYLLLSFLLVRVHAVEGALQAYFLANVCSFAVIVWLFRGLFRGNSTSQTQ
ncbi:O-antigen translocase [Flavobacterium sp.]|uniref:O-antigen translocase n=1 Tax=Flavobacterium sp. TaxID=239 RepID=UPI0039E501E7